MTILDEFSLEGKVAIVTGAGRGLGKAMAKGLAEVGADIVVAELQKNLAEESAADLAEIGVNTLPVQTDVTNVHSVKEMVSRALDNWSKVDILLNNAGVCRNIPAEKMSEEEWDKVINVNLKGVFLCAREVGKHMIERGGGGAIINVSSMSGSIANYPQPQIAYNVSKAGVTMVTKSLASEWAEHDIRVNEIAPGYMGTEMTKKFMTSHPEDIDEFWLKPTPMKRVGEPEELAGIAVYLASEASSFMTGSTVTIDGGYTVR